MFIVNKFYLHSITTRIKTLITVIGIAISCYSIFIPLEQGLRRVLFAVGVNLSYTIFIPLQQGLRQHNALGKLLPGVHSIFIPLQQGLRLIFTCYVCQLFQFYLHSITTRIKTQPWAAPLPQPAILSSFHYNKD